MESRIRFTNLTSLEPLPQPEIVDTNTESFGFPLRRQYAQGEEAFTSNRSSSPIQPLTRERDSDYGIFDTNFEHDVYNWFYHISNTERARLIGKLAEIIEHDTPQLDRRTGNGELRSIFNNNRLGAAEPHDTGILSRQTTTFPYSPPPNDTKMTLDEINDDNNTMEIDEMYDDSSSEEE